MGAEKVERFAKAVLERADGGVQDVGCFLECQALIIVQVDGFSCAFLELLNEGIKLARRILLGGSFKRTGSVSDAGFPPGVGLEAGKVFPPPPIDKKVKRNVWRKERRKGLAPITYSSRRNTANSSRRHDANMRRFRLRCSESHRCISLQHDKPFGIGAIHRVVQHAEASQR